MAAPKKQKRGKKKGTLSNKQHPSCKLTAQVIKEFAAEVERGNFRQVARQRLGIPVWTYNSWIAAGKKQLTEYTQGKRKKLLLQGQFVLALDRAEGYVHGQMVEDILEHGSIQARQWYLERRFNKLYSRNPNAHVDDETGEEHKVDGATVLAEKLAQLFGEEDE